LLKLLEIALNIENILLSHDPKSIKTCQGEKVVQNLCLSEEPPQLFIGHWEALFTNFFFSGLKMLVTLS